MGPGMMLVVPGDGAWTSSTVCPSDEAGVGRTPWWRPHQFGQRPGRESRGEVHASDILRDLAPTSNKIRRFLQKKPRQTMARRRKNELGEIVELLSVLPWWASLIAAVLSYAILHALARPPAV